MRGLIGAGLLGGGGGGKDGTKESVGSIALALLLDTQRSRVQLRKENVLVASIAVNMLIWIQSSEWMVTYACCAKLCQLIEILDFIPDKNDKLESGSATVRYVVTVDS